MRRRGRLAAIGAGLLLACALVLVIVRPLGVGYEKFDPVRAAVSSDDPLTLQVAVIWPYDGRCPDELRPIVDEDDDRITIKRVERHHGGLSGCAGVGIDPGSENFGAVALRAPVGDRPVIRASDDQVLPFSVVGS